MHKTLVRPDRAAVFAQILSYPMRTLVLFALLGSSAFGQIITRPIDPGIGNLPVIPGGPGGGGGGGGIGPGGGGGFPGIGIPINPIFPINPGGGVSTGPRIVTDTGMLAGQSTQASVVLPASPPTAAGPGQSTGGTSTPSTTYQWTISGGRITSDPTQSSVRFVADNAGTVALNVVVTTAGASQSTSAEVIVLSPALAGTITAPATARASAATVTASVPAAQSGDRTFRWSLAGNGAAIANGQGTNSVTLRPGAAGVVEVMCDVTLQRLATVTLRSFLVVTGDGQPTTLTVDNGTGGGTYAAGSRVDIFADPPSPGVVFDKWIGDTTVIGDPAHIGWPHVIVNVPAAPATLTATYKPVAEWTPVVVKNFNPIASASPTGTTFAYHVPAGPRGVVFLLHDTGDSRSDWFTRPEQLTLARDLVAAGFGVAALDSVNRTTGAWNTQSALASNPDAMTLGAALDRLIREELIAANTPVFLLGVGSGADAAALFARELTSGSASRAIKGAVLYCATGSATTAVASRVPQFFALAVHDEVLGTTGNAQARENSELLLGRGIATEVVTNPASPVPAGRFRRLGIGSPNFSAADAQAIWNAVKSAGLLDANNFPKSIPTLEAVRAALPVAFQSRAADVQAQLAVAFAGQKFFSDANARVIGFLDSRVADAPAPPAGRLVNLSTRTSIAYLGDSFTLGFVLTGKERATVLVRGVGPTLSRFRVTEPLPAPRLEIYRGNNLLAANEGWDASATAGEIVAATAAVGAFALPRGSLDTAVLLSLEPGAYTATLKSINGAVGEVLAEIYDVSKNATRLTNVSTLAQIGEDGAAVVPGLVIAGNNPRTLAVRAIGPGLTDLGFSSDAVLGDPRLVIRNVAGQTIATNDNWTAAGTTANAAMLNIVFRAVGAFPLRAGSNDAALVNALAPGSYLLQAAATPVATATGGSILSPNGTVLIEVYEVP
jgi:hypothetical protein